MGDWRLVLHSPHGRRVNDPWALAVSARLRRERGLDARATTGDDGIVVHLPQTTGRPPGAEVFRFEPGALRRTVLDALGSSALFAAHFRECAARALLLPGRTPGKRSPLWQQRRRASELLAVASGHPGFPILVETARECLADVYDMDALEAVMDGIEAGGVDLVEVETPVPSPFARSLLFGDVMASIYDADQPLAERRASLLSLDTHLLADLLGEADLASLLDAEVVRAVEGELQHTAPERRVHGVEGVADLLRALGPLSTQELAQRSEDSAGVEATVSALVAQGRAFAVDLGGRRVWVAVEDAARLRDGWGVELPVGIPEAFLAAVEDPVGDLVLRHARTHTVFTTASLATRLGLGVAVVDVVLEDLRGRDRVVRAEFGDLLDAVAQTRAIASPAGADGTAVGADGTPGGADGTPAGADGTPAGTGHDHQWVGTEVLRVLRLRSLSAARARTRAVSAPAFVRFLHDWQGVAHGHGMPGAQGVPGAQGAQWAPGAGASGEDLLRAVDQLAGVALPAQVWETQILPARVPGYSPALLDQLCATGEIIWWGSGGPGGSGGQGGPDGSGGPAGSDGSDASGASSGPCASTGGRSGARARTARDAAPGLVSFAPAGLAADLVPAARWNRDDVAEEAPGDAATTEPTTPPDLAAALLGVLAGGGAFFVDQLVPLLADARPDGFAPSRYEVGEALWELVWDGVVTNDTFAPVRALLAGTAQGRRGPAAHPRRGRIPRGGVALRGVGASLPARLGGRWSILDTRGADVTRSALARCETLVARHGILSRAAVLAEGVPGGFADLFPVLRALEDSGRVLRGHFVEGLGGAQFGEHTAVERLRMFDEGGPGVHARGEGAEVRTSGGPGTDGEVTAVALSVLDPANPFGSVLPWPPVVSADGEESDGDRKTEQGRSGTRGTRATGVPSRRAGALVVSCGGRPVLWLPGAGRSLLTFTVEETDLRAASVALVEALGRGGGGVVSVETVDGVPVSRSPMGEILHAAGFSRTPSGLRLHV